MHYYTFYAKDYASKASFLEPMEDLAYRRMLDLYYLTEKPLPSEVEEISVLIRMRSHCDCIATVLRYFFELTASGYINKKAETILAEYHGKSTKAKASADARWAKVKAEKNKKTIKVNDLESSCDSNANALETQCDGNANYKPITNNHKPLNNIKDIDSDKPKRFDFKKQLLNSGGDVDLVDAFMQVRKTKKATNSEKALQLFMKSVESSNMNLNQVLEICVQRDWKGFDISWLKNQNGFNQTQPQQQNGFIDFSNIGQKTEDLSQGDCFEHNDDNPF